jgi:hypothetical protein
MYCRVLEILPKRELGNEEKNNSLSKSTRKPDEPKIIQVTMVLTTGFKINI